MGLNLALIFLTFSTLSIIGWLNQDARAASLSRRPSEWQLDVAGLFIQGVFIPAVPFLLLPILTRLLPEYAQVVDLHPALQFALSFVLVDYAYYWNHRILHKRSLWPAHKVHHSSRHLDIFATSRNSLVSSFMIVYIWAQILGLFLLRESTPFMLGLGLTFALDLWRHSGTTPPRMFRKLFGWFLILPEHHVLHHSLTGRTKNYGANLNWWDRLHGTYSSVLIPNENLEKLLPTDTLTLLLNPWKKNK